MILLLHILIALASVGHITYVFARPSRTNLRVSYSLVAATIGSGTLLVVSSPSQAHLLQTCLVGIGYIAVVSYGLVLASHKLARSNITRQR